MRLVLDTSVLVAAIRSPRGASALLVKAALDGQFRPLISVPLVLEYEAVLTRREHLQASGFSETEAVNLVKALCARGEPVHLAHRLRPQLQDADDEFVLETAFNGRADAIVTFNERDFLPAVRFFGMEAISPGEAWRRVREL